MIESGLRHAYVASRHARKRDVKIVPRWLSAACAPLNKAFGKRRKFVADQRPKVAQRENNETLIETATESFWFPTSAERYYWRGMRAGYAKAYIEQKYQRAGFVEIAPGDVVVDCGAFNGGFAVAALGQGAGKVVCVEPSPVNFSCLKKNMARFDNAVVVNAGLFKENGAMAFNISENPFDSRLLAPDTGAVTDVLTVEFVTLNTLMDRNAIDKINFLKIEAEGVELEIVEAIDPERVEKIAIDCSPERDGQSPALDIVIRLDRMGYQTCVVNYMVYAKRAPLSQHSTEPKP